MIWPWQRQRLAIEKVQQEVADAIAQRHAAQKRQEEARRQAERSQVVSAKLREQIVRNGFTELLQEAWGKR